MHRIRYLVLAIMMMNVTILYAMSDIQPSDKVALRPELSEQRKSIDESAEIIRQVKESRPFVNIEQEKVWNFQDKTEESEASSPDLLWIAELFRLFAIIIEAALWLLPLVIIFYLYKYREYWINLVQGNGFQAKDKVLPETLFGLDISQQSLPDDVPGQARKLWASGEYRSAVSLLYRGSLASIFRSYTFELPPGATEQDCLREVEQSSHLTLQNPDEASSQSVPPSLLIEHFRLLTDLWVELAYAHKLPNDDHFNTLCEQWSRVYSREGGN